MIKHKKLTASDIAEEDKVAMEKAKKDPKFVAPHKRDASRSSHLSQHKDESISDTKSTHSEMIDRMVEMDQEDKAFAVTGRP